MDDEVTVYSHSYTNIWYVSLTSAGLRSPRTFVIINILAVILERSEPLVQLCAAPTLLSLYTILR